MNKNLMNAYNIELQAEKIRKSLKEITVNSTLSEHREKEIEIYLNQNIEKFENNADVEQYENFYNGYVEIRKKIYIPADQITKDELLEYLEIDDPFWPEVIKNAYDNDIQRQADYIEKDNQLLIELSYFFVKKLTRDYEI